MYDISKHRKYQSILPMLKQRPVKLEHNSVFPTNDTYTLDFKTILSPYQAHNTSLLTQLNLPTSFSSYFLKSPLNKNKYEKHDEIRRDKSEPRLRLPGRLNNDTISQKKINRSIQLPWNCHKNDRSIKLEAIVPQNTTIEKRNSLFKFSEEDSPKNSKSPGRDKNYGSKKHISILGALSKRYLLSRKIMKEYEIDDVSFSKGKNTKQLNKADSVIQKSRKISLVLSTVDFKASIIRVLNLLEEVIVNVKNKQIFDKIIEKAVEIALESKNSELYKGILKLQAKAMMAFSDIYKALGIFKNLKQVAESNKDYECKLIVYKYLGKCFQKIGNHKMASFYFIKLLQMAWLCKKPRYELLAYDLIGIQYFYLRDLERAKFYHNKSVEGRIEPEGSELRRSGINKILVKMNEGIHQKKIKHVKTIEEELAGYNIPLSEDDFELPLPEYQYYSKNEEHKENSTGTEIKDKSVGRKKFVDYKSVFLLKKQPNLNKSTTRKGVIRTRLGVLEKDQHSLTLEDTEDEDREILEETGKKHVFLSHLSPNRLVQNFNYKDAKDVVNDYLAKGNGKEGFAMGIDGKEAEKLKRKLLKFKKNLEQTLKQIAHLELFRQQIESKSNFSIVSGESSDYIKSMKARR